MQKIILFIAISILSFTKLVNAQNLPQLQAGVYIFDTLDVYTDNFTGSCGGSASFSYGVNLGTIPIATGINLELLVSQLPSGTVTNNVTGTVHLNDIYVFLSSNSYFTFTSATSGTMKVKVILTGTPTILNQKYSCFLGDGIVGPCPLAHGFFGTDSCFVTAATGIAEINNSSSVNIYNNSASNSIHIQYESSLVQTVTFHLFNLLGQEVLSTSFHDTTKTIELPAGKLCSGLYIWEIIGADGVRRTGKLIK